mmetsp:Transcript_20004/g.50439  ORF Transcript_20004/g.50439 Transcript_20004/m.50439 type:complete len:568 (-) Transcript_20004:643-2346(-)
MILRDGVLTQPIRTSRVDGDGGGPARAQRPAARLGLPTPGSATLAAGRGAWAQARRRRERLRGLGRRCRLQGCVGVAGDRRRRACAQRLGGSVVALAAGLALTSRWRLSRLCGGLHDGRRRGRPLGGRALSRVVSLRAGLMRRDDLNGRQAGGRGDQRRVGGGGANVGRRRRARHHELPQLPTGPGGLGSLRGRGGRPRRCRAEVAAEQAAQEGQRRRAGGSAGAARRDDVQARRLRGRRRALCPCGGRTAEAGGVGGEGGVVEQQAVHVGEQLPAQRRVLRVQPRLHARQRLEQRGARGAQLGLHAAQQRVVLALVVAVRKVAVHQQRGARRQPHPAHERLVVDGGELELRAEDVRGVAARGKGHQRRRGRQQQHDVAGRVGLQQRAAAGHREALRHQRGRQQDEAREARAASGARRGGQEPHRKRAPVEEHVLQRVAAPQHEQHQPVRAPLVVQNHIHRGPYPRRVLRQGARLLQHAVLLLYVLLLGGGQHVRALLRVAPLVERRLRSLALRRLQRREACPHVRLLPEQLVALRERGGEALGDNFAALLQVLHTRQRLRHAGRHA